MIQEIDSSSAVATPSGEQPPAPAQETSPKSATKETGRRGLLDIKVTLSNPSPTAGSEFTLYVLVTNPFDVPIWPESPQVFLPSEIRTISMGSSLTTSTESLNLLINKAAKGEVLPRSDLGASTSDVKRRSFWVWRDATRRTEPTAPGIADQLKYLGGEAQKLDEELVGLELAREKTKSDIEQLTAGKSLTEKLKISETDPEMKSLMAELSEKTKQLDMKRERMGILRDEIIVLSGSSAVIADADLTLRNFSVARSFYIRAKGKVILDSPVKTPVVTLDSSLRPGDALQPGNTAVYSLLLTTKSRLLFRPIQYSLQHSLNFSFDAERTEVHTNTANQFMTIRAPITSVMVGAIIGGMAGFGAKSLQDLQKISLEPTPVAWTGWLLTPILSAMAVVFLARKSETQSMVSVEDFWGGLVIGFLVGYGGATAFEGFANIQKPE